MPYVHIHHQKGNNNSYAPFYFQIQIDIRAHLCNDV